MGAFRATSTDMAMGVPPRTGAEKRLRVPFSPKNVFTPNRAITRQPLPLGYRIWLYRQTHSNFAA